MKFVFHLQKVLDYRANNEEKKKKELAYWVSEENKIKNLIHSIEKNPLSEADKMLFSDTSSIDREYFYQYASNSKNIIFSHQQKLLELQTSLNEARKNYLLSKKEREVLEFLKEKKYKEWLSIKRKKESKQLENLNLQLFYKGKSNPSK